VNLAMKLLISTMAVGLAVSAQAQVPVGPEPPTSPIPTGLDPSGPWYPTPSGTTGVPVTSGQELFASGGPIYVTDLGPTAAGYDEQLFVEMPNTGYGLFMDNHSTGNGTTYYLGTYAAGTEFEFGLDVLTTGDVWYDGPGSRNSDGAVHAYMVNNYEGLANTTYVGFEDEPASFADFNYVDEVYAFTGAASVQVVPEPATYGALAGLGMIVVSLRSQFRRPKA